MAGAERSIYLALSGATCIPSAAALQREGVGFRVQVQLEAAVLRVVQQVVRQRRILHEDLKQPRSRVRSKGVCRKRCSSQKGRGRLLRRA